MQEKYPNKRVVVVVWVGGCQTLGSKVGVDMAKPGKTNFKTEFLSLSVSLPHTQAMKTPERADIRVYGTSSRCVCVCRCVRSMACLACAEQKKGVTVSRQRSEMGIKEVE